MTGSGSVKSPDARPGETVAVLIDYSDGLQEADLFRFTAIDPHGMEVNTWSWPVIQPAEKAVELLTALSSKASEISVEETEHSVKASVNGLHLSFRKEDGTLLSVTNQKGAVSFTGGPVVAGVESKVKGTTWKMNSEGNFEFVITTEGYPRKISWELFKNGMLKM